MLRARAVEVVVEVAAVPARETVRQRLAVGRDADDADHRPRREAHALVHLDPAVLDPEDAASAAPATCSISCPKPGISVATPRLDRLDVEELDDERVARLGAGDRDGPGRAVDALEVDLGDEVVLGLGSAR